MSNVVGEEFQNYVGNQIKQRQIVHSSGVDSLRTGDQISYLNSKTGWVKFVYRSKSKSNINYMRHFF